MAGRVGVTARRGRRGFAAAGTTGPPWNRARIIPAMARSPMASPPMGRPGLLDRFQAIRLHKNVMNAALRQSFSEVSHGAIAGAKV